MRSLFSLALFLIAAAAAAQSPVLHRVLPLGIPAGKTTEVQLIGERLDGITDLWCSAAGVRLVPTNGARLAVTVPSDAAGIIALRVATTNGLSDVAMMMVDAIASFAESKTNKSMAAAQLIGKPAAVDATTDELAFDFYSIAAKRGETISMDVVASRMGSKLDPVLRILDDQKRELAFCEDASGAGRDCRLQFRALRTGAYHIEVRDITYGGGPQHFYRLRIGRFSFPTCTYPLVAAPGAELTVLGPINERFKPAKVKLHGATPSYAPLVNGFVPLRSDDIPSQYFETEPNENRARANHVSLPHVINGRFEHEKDRDWFQLDIKKDEHWVFATRSRAYGSPCDVFLELRDPEGKTVAESNPAGPQDTTLIHQFTSAGRHYLVARELADRGAPDLAYQIAVRLAAPDFTLAIEDDKIEAKPSAEFSLPVSCARFDFDGNIALELEGLPDAFVIENATIDAKKTNATIKVKVPDAAEPGQLLAFRIIGRAGDKRVVASTRNALRRNFVTMLYPPPEIDGTIALGITGSEPAPKGRRRRS